MDGLIRMIMNVFLRQIIGKGINAGLNAASGKGRKRRHQMDLEPPKNERYRNDGAGDLVHDDIEDEDAANRRAERDRIREMRQARRARRNQDRS